MNNIEVIGTAQVLKDAGVEPVQAEAIAKVVVAKRDDLATKSDIAKLKTDIEALRVGTKSDIAELKTDIEALRVSTKSDIEALRVSTKSDISSLRAELKSDIAELKSEIDSHRSLSDSKFNNLRWTMVVVGGIIVALIKFLP